MVETFYYRRRGNGPSSVGFYVRTSLRADPFRLNLSKPDLGVSVGVPGFRIGFGPRGNYIYVGAAGRNYRATETPKPGLAVTF